MAYPKVSLKTVAIIDRTVATIEECEISPYVGLEHIEKETGNFVSDFEAKPEALLATKFKFTPEHILYGKLRPYLNKVALPNFEGVCTTEILPILPNPKTLDRQYLWLFFLSPEFVSWASDNVSGANLPRLSPKKLSEYKISLPPLSEQKRIAAIASKADRLRRTRRYTQQLSDTYLQSVFLEMFGDPEIAPKGWPEREIKELCEAITDCVNKTAPVVNYITPYKMIRTTNIRNGLINLSSVRYVTQETFKKWTRRSVPTTGDIILTREAPLGETGMIRSQDMVFLGQRLVQYRVNPKILNNWYLLHAFQSSYLQNQLKLLGAGSTVEHIAVPDCETLLIPLPPLSLQQKFATIVKNFERLRTQQREADRQAEHLFQSILHRAFQGEL